jgi:hypothetical protein
VLDLLVSTGTIQGDQKKYVKGVSVEWALVEECEVKIFQAQTRLTKFLIQDH